MTSVKLRLPGPNAVIFSSGMARAASQIGMWQAAAEAGVQPELIVGSSTGAVNAALLAAEPEHFVEQATALWSAVAIDKPLASGWRTTARGLARKQSNRTRNMLLGHLTAVFGHQTFDELAIPLTVMATELNSGQPVTLREGPIVDALIASMSFPVVLPPTEHDADLLVDASFTAGIPVTAALDQGARSLTVLDAGGSVFSDDDVTDIGWHTVAAISAMHMLRVQALHDLDQAAREVPTVLFACNDGSPFNLRAAPGLIEHGHEIAEQIIAEILRDRPSRHISRPGLYGATTSG